MTPYLSFILEKLKRMEYSLKSSYTKMPLIFGILDTAKGKPIFRKSLKINIRLIFLPSFLLT